LARVSFPDFIFFEVFARDVPPLGPSPFISLFPVSREDFILPRPGIDSKMEVSRPVAVFWGIGLANKTEWLSALYLFTNAFEAGPEMCVERIKDLTTGLFVPNDDNVPPIPLFFGTRMERCIDDCPSPDSPDISPSGSVAVLPEMDTPKCPIMIAPLPKRKPTHLIGFERKHDFGSHGIFHTVRYFS